ncbi:hypothetical protein FQP88_20335 [Vibrio atlanticus]|nr:hypothetical protein FQP88_20335 [Vibrio atlanticus]
MNLRIKYSSAMLLLFFVPFSAISSSHLQYGVNNGLYAERDFRAGSELPHLFSQASDGEYVHLYYGSIVPKESFINELSQHIKESSSFLWFDQVSNRYRLMMKIPQGTDKADFLARVRQYVPDAFLWSWAGYTQEQESSALTDFQPVKGPELPSLGSEGVSDESVSTVVAGELTIAGKALSDGGPSNYTDSVVSRAQNYANQQLENSVTDWLSPYATVKFSTDLLNNLKDPSASLNALVPLYDSESQLLFTQFGYQANGDSAFSGRDFLNIGLGTRYSTDDYLVGVNAFFDRDMTRSHQRSSVGVEGFADYLKLTGNYYFPLSDWKNSTDFDNYEERAARGFDVDVTGYLPSYSHLGASLSYEQYFGNEVDILGTKNKQSNPYAGTLTLDYTPIPLLSLNTGITKAKGSSASLKAGIDVTYRFGVPWKKQVSPDYVDATRQLDGQRYDLVQRNNNIVLE